MEELITLKGKVRFIECDGTKYPAYSDVNKAIANGDAEISEWKSNTICTVGKTAIARRLINAATKTSEGIITYGAVGTGSTTPVASDTTLTTELFRKVIAYTENTDNVLMIRTYLTTSEGNGILTEFGLFGEEATGSADSGTLFNHITIAKTKTASKTLTIEATITIS